MLLQLYCSLIFVFLHTFVPNSKLADVIMSYVLYGCSMHYIIKDLESTDYQNKGKKKNFMQNIK